jgi:hypothetical protein
MEWAKKRKILYATIFGLIVILIAIYPIYVATHPANSCFDNAQNGNETGVDCGDGCSLTCLVDIKPLNFVWTKAFALGGSSYDLGAYVENPNLKSGVKNARYTFRVFDEGGSVLTTVSGSTEIPPGTGFVLFEPHVTIAGSPSRVDVAFNSSDLAHWTKASVPTSVVTTKNQDLKNIDSAPRFDATLVNTDLENPVENLTVNAIVYDAARHPIALSRTSVDSIPMGGTQDIFYTWPIRFSKHTGGGICTNPVDTMLVIDRSGSMDVGSKNPPEPITTAKNAANTYIDAAELVDKVGLVSFATTASNPIEHSLTLDHEAVKNSIAAIQVLKNTSQYTDFGEALRAAVVELQGGDHTPGAKPVIVAMTDGVTNRPLDPTNPNNKAFPEQYAVQVAGVARNAGIEVYTIGLGKDLNTAFLRDQISTDPSHYFVAPTATDLVGVYKKISETVCKEEGFITDIVITPRATFAQ